MSKRVFAVVMMCIAVTLSGCSMEIKDKVEEPGVMEQVGQQLLEGLITSAAESYEDSLNYRYPVSKEFREQQIDKLVKEEVNRHLDTISFIE